MWNEEKFNNFLKLTQGKQYNIKFKNIICRSNNKEKKNWTYKKGFICSSLVFCAYLHLGICDFYKNVDEILPGDFSHHKCLPLKKPFELSPEIIIDFTN